MSKLAVTPRMQVRVWSACLSSLYVCDTRQLTAFPARVQGARPPFTHLFSLPLSGEKAESGQGTSLATDLLWEPRGFCTSVLEQ